MPYSSLSDLPGNVLKFPKHAQEIFLESFNAALKQYGDESKAFAVAYAAVEKAGYSTKTAQKFAIALPLVKAASENGRWIIQGETSNEMEDVDGEVVLGKAIEPEIDEYLKRGTLRWQHNPGNVPLGRVIELTIRNGKTFFKAELSKASDKAREIWNQLKENLVYYGASIGGQILNVMHKYEPEIRKNVKLITKIRLDEISLTDNPANRETWVHAAPGLAKAAEKFLEDRETGILVCAGSARYRLRKCGNSLMLYLRGE